MVSCCQVAAGDGEGTQALADIGGVGGEFVDAAVRAGPGVGGGAVAACGAAVAAWELRGIDADLAGACMGVGQADGGVGGGGRA